MVENLELARAILNEALNGEFLDPSEYPVEEEEILKDANFYADHAKKEYNTGWGKGNDTIRAIVTLLEASEEAANSLDQSAQEDQLSSSASSAFFRDLPIPHVSPGAQGIEMPWDIAGLSDLQLRKYHGLMSHYFSAARYLLAEENALLDGSEKIKDDAFRKALKRISDEAIKKDTKKSAVVLNAEASLDESFQEWDEKVKQHEGDAGRLKALVDIYGKNVDVLSREATIRQNEFERSR